MTLRFGVLVLGLMVSPLSGFAQRRPVKYSVAIEFREQAGGERDETDRHGGLALRLIGDGPWSTTFGWRIEGAYTQNQYDLRTEEGNVPISETGFELGAMARATHRFGLNWRPYVLGGAILSIRGSCTFDNAFDRNNVVRCGDGQTIRPGWGAGAGTRYAAGLAGWDWFVEARILGNLTSNGGGRSMAVAFGAGR